MHTVQLHSGESIFAATTNYPDPYPNNWNQTWIITADADKQVTLLS